MGLLRHFVSYSTSCSRQDPLRKVLVSQSNDIFRNLALEDWLYRHYDFKNQHLLLLWRNDPCVVVGRHQNPWIEANLPYLRNHKIELARRNSGGGTVYHDRGNINCTFFTPRDHYRRRHNLDIVCSAIKRLTDLNVVVNSREDIVLNQEKISGTAAKLGGNSAYHHCTVLVDVNACVLHDSLHSKAVGFESKATQSVRVPVRNIKDAAPFVSIQELVESIGYEFLRTDMDGKDCGFETRNNQGFHLVRPDDGWYPGIDKIRDELQGYNWIFGKTPKFKIHRSFDFPSDLLSTPESSRLYPVLEVELEIHRGLVHDVSVTFPVKGVLENNIDLSTILYGRPFTQDLVNIMEKSLDNVEQRLKKFLLDCIRNILDGVV